MATNDALRQQVSRLIALGVNQKAIAKRLHVSETWLSRWVNEKRDRSVMSVDAMDRLASYLDDFARVREDVALAQPARAGRAIARPKIDVSTVTRKRG